MFAAGAARARQAWTDAGRDGEPKLGALAYACLGDDVEAHVRGYLGGYYSFLGEWVEQIIAGALTTPQAVADAVAAFDAAGCDELILFPCNPDLAQVSLIAAAAGL
jgi:hypothetical protein